MSSLLRKISKDKKDYKKLYEIELNNRKMYEKRYKELCSENIELQKQTGLANLRKENMELKDKLFELNMKLGQIKEDRAKLYIQLDDLRNELALRKDKENGK